MEYGRSVCSYPRDENERYQDIPRTFNKAITPHLHAMHYHFDQNLSSSNSKSFVICILFPADMQPFLHNSTQCNIKCNRFHTRRTTKSTGEIYQKMTPNPPTNHVKESSVTAAIAQVKPSACRSMSESAPLHVAHLNSRTNC